MVRLFLPYIEMEYMKQILMQFSGFQIKNLNLLFNVMPPLRSFLAKKSWTSPYHAKASTPPFISFQKCPKRRGLSMISVLLSNQWDGTDFLIAISFFWLDILWSYPHVTYSKMWHFYTSHTLVIFHQDSISLFP